MTETPDPRPTTTEGRDDDIRDVDDLRGMLPDEIVAEVDRLRLERDQLREQLTGCQLERAGITQERDRLRVDLTRARLERDDARSWAARWKAWAKGCHSQRLSWRQRAYAVWQREHAPALAARTAELAALREAVNRAVADLEICSMQSSPTLQWEHFKRALRALAAAPEPSADAAQEASS